jgi:hypothetical protein
MKEFLIIIFTVLLGTIGVVIQLCRHPDRKEKGEGPYYVGGFFQDVILPFSIAGLTEIVLIWIFK